MLPVILEEDPNNMEVDDEQQKIVHNQIKLNCLYNNYSEIKKCSWNFTTYLLENSAMKGNKISINNFSNMTP